MLLTPSGHSAHKIEKVILLHLWANALKEEIEQHNPITAKKIIFAGLGKPTYPINKQTIASYLSYWQNMEDICNQNVQDTHSILNGMAIDYGDPRGDTMPRSIMARRMSEWYQSEIKPDNILFTVGGIGALKVIFDTLHSFYEEISGYRIITPFPHYSCYAHNSLHRLHPVDVMKEPGYKLTAAGLEESIQEAYLLAQTDYGLPKAVLMCNPSNPLGTVIDELELIKIAAVLRRYPELHIIFDEAYTEMSFREMPSFLKIAPDLKNRVIIIRSATKALSAAGERMAVLLVFEPSLMNEILNKNMSYFIHAPRSAQMAYAQTMEHFDAEERLKLSEFYKKKVHYVLHRLHAMGAAMPDPSYKVEATFYALADFGDLFNLELPQDAWRALQKTGQIKTGEELAYYLLFSDSVMITPLSYFGLEKNSGFMRITCSDKEEELKELMDRLEQRLLIARLNKKAELMNEVSFLLPELKKMDASLYQILFEKIAQITQVEENCLSLKIMNQELKVIHLKMMSCLKFKDNINVPKSPRKASEGVSICFHD